MYIPVHNINSQIGLNYRGYGFVCHIGYTGKRYTQTEAGESDNVIVLKPYLITDISLGKDLNMQKFRLNFNFRASNIFNQEYQVVLARPMPGRNYSFIFGISF
jgi:iron complex outermembrane receptor protein